MDGGVDPAVLKEWERRSVEDPQYAIALAIWYTTGVIDRDAVIEVVGKKKRASQRTITNVTSLVNEWIEGNYENLSGKRLTNEEVFRAFNEHLRNIGEQEISKIEFGRRIMASQAVVKGEVVRVETKRLRVDGGGRRNRYFIFPSIPSCSDSDGDDVFQDI